jgi:hypothetical protein
MLTVVSGSGLAALLVRRGSEKGGVVVENKPEALYDRNWFTARVLEHERVGYYAYPPDADCAALVAFVSDEILVAEEVLDHGPAADRLNERCEALGTVFDDESKPGKQNVQIWRLPGAGGGREADVAEFVWSFREEIISKAGHLEPSQVAPNHVVIPAPNYHACPWGPPEPPRDDGTPPEIREGAARVAVIDSGWEDDGPAPGVVANVVPAPRFGLLPTGALGWLPPAVSPRVDPAGRLLALEGHANFVAGVVAQACCEAEITVESLNAAFVEANSDPGLPTEAAVARAFWNQHRNDFIHIGFAFATLPDPSRGNPLLGGPPPWTFQLVLDALREMGKDKPFVVAPAGNQNCIVPQYPAAFWPTYENVVGVGSMRNPSNRSSFSNHGDWVRCCSEGDDVVSMFINFDGETEEPEPGPGDLHPRKYFTGWAAWSGTSFSSPKVTGALACRKREDGTPEDAWDALVAERGLGAGLLDMGNRLRHLPPRQ